MADLNAAGTVNEMDQSNFEDAVRAALEKRLGHEPDVFGEEDNENYGVVPFARLDGLELRKIDWQEVAAELARETGVGVTCIANCDWNMNSRRHDEEATFIAFAVPGVADGYRDDPYRNLISAVDPATAPSEVDFVNLRRARQIVVAHLEELHGRREVLIAAKKDESETLGRIMAIEGLKDLEAGDREAVKAVIELNFDAAIAVAAALEVGSPRM